VNSASNRIRIPITEQDELTADAVAEFRQHRKQTKGLKHNGLGDHGHDYRAVLAEIAVRRYLGAKPPAGWRTMTEQDDRRQGCDIIHEGTKWEVRSRQNTRAGLIVKPRDPLNVRYALVLTHQIDHRVIWLAGWIDAPEARKAMVPVRLSWGEFLEVPQEKLKPFSVTSEYKSVGSVLKNLVDMSTPFWCEICGRMHALREHRDCRRIAA
jgi:hypothetical protein